MTNLSPAHKLHTQQDQGLDTLLDLDGTIMEVGGGYWVKIQARQVEPDGTRPHGISYSLCLFGPEDERLICYDNAHPVKTGSGPAKKLSDTNDHVHKGEVVKPYEYTDAGTLVVDFWTEMEKILKKAGIT